jgi:hypothetical protein
MPDDEPVKPAGQRLFVYHANLPPVLALVLFAPLLLLFLSFAAVALAGGTLAALALPLFLRSRRRREPESDCIELSRDEYSRVEDDRRQLPPR